MLNLLVDKASVNKSTRLEMPCQLVNLLLVNCNLSLRKLNNLKR